MRNYALIVLCLVMGVVMSACAGDFQPQPQLNSGDSASHSDGVAQQWEQKKGALSSIIVPGTGLAQDCTPPFDVNCTALGPTDQMTCLPTGLNTGTCQLYSTDDYATYADGVFLMDNKFTYISCPGSATTTDANDPLVKAENDYCATQNPFPDKGDYTSRCIVTEKTAAVDGDRGRCAYFLKECFMAEGTPCFAKGYLIAGTTTCSVSAKMDAAAKFETCNDSVDNNCNGDVDEENAVGCLDYWVDTDGDGYGSGPATKHCLCGKPSGVVTNNEDCNDSNKDINPLVSEVCDSVDNNCDGKTDEAFSGLGAACGTGACANGKTVCSADGTKTVCSNASLASTEVCDGADNDCDGNTDEDYTDLASSCGVGACSGGAMVCKADKSGTVCNSNNKASSEVCDGADNDCDGNTDEDYTDLAWSCGVGACSGGAMVCLADKSGTVCNSNSKASSEVCDGVDNDCDGKTDEDYTDLASSCGVGACSGGAMVCKADKSGTVCSTDNKAATEVCDGADNDCDGQTDENVMKTFYEDKDGDSFGNASSTKQACAAPETHVSDKTDCNDTNVSVNPGATEVCNQIDDDCDGTTDVDASGKALCDLKCPTVVKYDCNVEYEIDFSTLKSTNTISTYNCWTSVGAKTSAYTFASPEVFMAPNAKNGTKYSFLFTTAGTGTVVTTLHGTCEPNQGTTAVSAYNPGKGLNGTCSGFSTSSASGVVGEDYQGLDKITATGKVKFKFICTP